MDTLRTTQSTGAKNALSEFESFRFESCDRSSHRFHTLVVVVGVVVVVAVLVDVAVVVGKANWVVVETTTTDCVVGASVSVGTAALALISGGAASRCGGATCSGDSVSLSGGTATVDGAIGGADGTASIVTLLGVTAARSALVLVALVKRFLLTGADAALQRFRPQHSLMRARAI